MSNKKNQSIDKKDQSTDKKNQSTDKKNQSTDKEQTTEKQFIFDSDVTNDTIDIYDEPDVVVTKKKTNSDIIFHAVLEGNSVDYSVSNAIRRAILIYIPIYGFNRTNIVIENEKSLHMYNNDLIYNQIESLPIFDIPNYFDVVNPEVFMSNEVMKKIFSSFIPDKYVTDEEDKQEDDSKKKLFHIEFTLNVKNTTSKNMFVSTHDAIFKIDGKISQNYLKHKPISIIVLKPLEQISLSAIANLGISKMNATYEATDNAVSLEISPTCYEIRYETLEQLDKNIIFQKACTILIRKLESLGKYIKKKYIDDQNNEIISAKSIELNLYGEDHTIGNLLATTLQKCKHVEKAGYYIVHPFIDEIGIGYELKNSYKGNPINVFIDVIEYLKKLFTKIKDSSAESVAKN
jgi:DNA-directed RNA polymerase subunit L